jgi:hypothetical protein
MAVLQPADHGPLDPLVNGTVPDRLDVAFVRAIKEGQGFQKRF